ncbi:MAG: hypothetical protein M1528_01765 [Candidatus Marsarchaeota archaeon]|nr:hypothetical protein [Candidatus Marsarchaeota archaeon]MCL5115237.1 hypothetical protein [Candidatus Marsarchaeota archaeon]
MRDTKVALKWIVGILERNKVKFEVSGGFAARVYGSKRRLADIDIDVRQIDIKRIIPSISKWAVYGPSRYTDRHWRIPLLITLRYKGQTIDIFGADKVKIFDAKAKQWVSFPFMAGCTRRRTIFGVRIPVIDRKVLISYKSKLSRGVDRADVAELSNDIVDERMKPYKKI